MCLFHVFIFMVFLINCIIISLSVSQSMSTTKVHKFANWLKIHKDNNIFITISKSLPQLPIIYLLN